MHEWLGHDVASVSIAVSPQSAPAAPLLERANSACTRIELRPAERPATTDAPARVIAT